MVSAVHLEATVQPDGKIELHVPELQPGQRVKVTIETQDSPPTPGRHVIDLVKDLPGHRIFKTAEEVDAYIREELDSWDR